MTDDKTTRTVWIGCLASYNAGHLHGVWFDLDDYTNCDEWIQAIKDMIAAGPSPHGEEWHVCDYEGWYSLEIDRYESVATIWEWHEAFNECEHVPGEVVAHMLSEHPACPAESIGDCYRGTWDSLESYAQEYADDCGLLGSVPGLLEGHIDWTGVARDLCMDLTELDCSEGVHLIDPNAY